MMKFKYLFTRREIESQVFYDIVFEWEKVLSELVGLKYYYYDDKMSDLGGGKCLNISILRRLIRRSILIRRFCAPHSLGLKFDMNPVDKERYNSEHIVPWIIDFFWEENKFAQFCEAYKKHPLVLISSREVYDKLKAHNDIMKNVNLKHLALSISDLYHIDKDTKFEKMYDVALMGRTNPVLEKYFYQYVAEHPAMRYVYRKIEGNNFNYYIVENERESFLGTVNTREQYMDLMRRTRIGLYCTPDIDTDHLRSHGYNQVTPRFLEWVSSGAHIIARYVPNSDTGYYNLQDFSEPIETYDQFEKAMDYAMSHEVDMAKYSEYLSHHYTSVRAMELKRIIETI